MRPNVLGLAAAACWTGVSASLVDRIQAGAHKVIADVGANHPKNSSSVFWSKLRGTEVEVAKTLELRQSGAGGRCGPSGGNARCTDNLCCSDYGYCGDSMDHCAPLFYCQPNFGVCGWPRAAPPPATTSAPPPPPPPPPPPTTTSAPPPPPPPPTTTSAPPPPPTTTSAPPRPPTTTTSAVVVPPTSTQPVTPNPTGLRVTTNGQCGNGTVCIGSSQWGACCSQFFWCGSTLDYCGAGCQSQFGACFGVPGVPGLPPTNGTSVPVPPSSTAVVPPTSAAPTTSAIVTTSIVPLPPTTTSAPPPPPPPTTTTSARPTTTAPALPAGQRTSTDGRCGSGQNCIGSTYGRCCSQFGWCGDGDQFCPPIVGCQVEFGICDPARP